jgi:hypothetical protein
MVFIESIKLISSYIHCVCVTHRHGLVEQRGMNKAAMTDAGPVRSHRFGNQFANLPVYDRATAFLRRLGSAGGPLFGEPNPEDDADVPAGVAFFGQFIDHEITFDPTSEIDRRNDPQALRNFRTPALDLDSVYGSGPEASPYLYDHRDEAKLLTDPDAEPTPDDEDAPRAARYGATDLQRNSHDVAMVNDPRNDENVIISQLHLAFIKFHNRMVDYVRSGPGHALVEDKEYLEAAERLVRWHYQWVVIHDFLPSVCDNSILEDIIANGREYFLTGDEIAIPVEFAGAAYRYGHSQIRDSYDINDNTSDVSFFPGPPDKMLADMFEDADPENPPDMSEMVDGDNSMSNGRSLSGQRPVPDDLVVDWSHFFDVGDAAETDPQPARKIDAKLPPALFLLPFIPEHEEQSLAARNLLRGAALGLPSGQAVASAMDIDPLPNAELLLADDQDLQTYLRSQHRGADDNAPLWLYILAEADTQNDGNRLGAVGSRVVAEVIHGMVDADSQAYPNADSDWTPTLPRPVSAPDVEDPLTADAPFGFGDLLHFATGPTPDGLEIATIDADGTGDTPDPDTVDSDTDGEAVLLEHTGSGPLSLSGYTIDFEDDQTYTFDDIRLLPGDSVVVYTGTDELDSSEHHVVSLEFPGPVIDNTGESVTVRTPTDEVSALARFDG